MGKGGPEGSRAGQEARDRIGTKRELGRPDSPAMWLAIAIAVGLLGNPAGTTRRASPSHCPGRARNNRGATLGRP
jgi:hypothetical protein